jgi:glycosyltransferase involved in cell wall biosynthesis
MIMPANSNSSSDDARQGSSQENNQASEPPVSVVTPFYNTREFLPECIESVLRQSYRNWEYVLVDNCSTDGSSEIAQNYASRYPGKIRLVHTNSFLTQVQNYNFAISCIAPDSKYCKMVQADDWIFPECIRSMVEVAEAHPSVGIVGAYELAGESVDMDGLPYPSHEVSGRDVCRLYFLKNKYIFGTPTSLLLRSDLIRSRVPFYEERYAPFEDAHVCFDLLKTWTFGFVHQVLTYSRRDNESILTRARALGLLHFFRLAVVVAHGRDYLSAEEYDRCLKDAERRYFLHLSRCKLRGRDPDFWEFHRKGLASIKYSLDWRLFVKWTPRALLEKTWETFWAWRDKKSCVTADDDVESSDGPLTNEGKKTMTKTVT